MAHDTPLAPSGALVRNIDDVFRLAEVIAKSNLFPDVRTGAQAVVKILAGLEMGFGPFAALADVHVIEGKPSIGAHLRAAAIRRPGSGYDYDILHLDGQRCEVEFFRLEGQGRRSLGCVSYTIEEAKRSGIATGRDGKLRANWHRTPDDMLFARCMSKGYRRFTPDLSGGVLAYAPDELDTDDSPQQSLSQAREVTDGEGRLIKSNVAMIEHRAAPAQPPFEDGQTVTIPRITREQFQRIHDLKDALKMDYAAIAKGMQHYFGFTDLSALTTEQADKLIAKLESKQPPTT